MARLTEFLFLKDFSEILIPPRARCGNDIVRCIESNGGDGGIGIGGLCFQRPVSCSVNQHSYTKLLTLVVEPTWFLAEFVADALTLALRTAAGVQLAA